MSATLLQYQQAPGLLSQYRRAFFAKGKKGATALPQVEAQLKQVSINAKKAAAYANVCGFKGYKDQATLTYPHILAFPLHMELMLHRDFPFALMGLVHIRNKVTQHRAIKLNEKLDIRCFFGTLIESDKGLEFDIFTEVRINGELVWESVSTNLKRQKTSRSKAKRARSEQLRFNVQEPWSLATDLGRRYARVSGDSNPIHLFSLTAKLFGFKGHIAHGMWSKARAAATLYPLLNSDRCELNVEFKQPVFLPCKLDLYWNPVKSQTPAGTHFELRDKNSDKCHMQGLIRTF